MEAESFIAQAMPERPRAAVFRFALEDFGGEARRAEAKAALRSWLLALPYGDQGLLIPKRLYQKLGGYRALARHGRCRSGAPHRAAAAGALARPRRQSRRVRIKARLRGLCAVAAARSARSQPGVGQACEISLHR